MPSLAEFEKSLGLEAGTLTSKPNAEATFSGYFSEAETKLAEAQRLTTDAQNLQRTIDEQIAKFGINESSVIQLQAQLAAVKAAHAELEKNGVKLDLNLPTNLPAVKDPQEAFRENVVKGFTQIGQAMSVQNRYYQTFGKPMPDDPVALADEAARNGMAYDAYAEKKYGFQAEAKRKAEAEVQARIDAGIKKYQEEHPSNAGHPELNGGLPSNYPAMPKPREAKDLRQFSGLPAREKIADAMRRANEAAKSAA
jgi:hypothetical protein